MLSADSLDDLLLTAVSVAVLFGVVVVSVVFLVAAVDVVFVVAVVVVAVGVAVFVSGAGAGDFSTTNREALTFDVEALDASAVVFVFASVVDELAVTGFAGVFEMSDDSFLVTVGGDRDDCVAALEDIAADDEDSDLFAGVAVTATVCFVTFDEDVVVDGAAAVVDVPSGVVVDVEDCEDDSNR